VASVLSSLRYLLADFIGEDDDTPPSLPDGLPEGAAPVVSEGIHLLIDYQGAGYARLYVERLRRFIGRRDVDGTMFAEIARLMAMRMSYEDPIRIAQQKLAELETGAGIRAVHRPTMSGNSGSMNWSVRSRPRSPNRCSTSLNGWVGRTSGLDPLQHQKPWAFAA